MPTTTTPATPTQVRALVESVRRWVYDHAWRDPGKTVLLTWAGKATISGLLSRKLVEPHATESTLYVLTDAGRKVAEDAHADSYGQTVEERLAEVIADREEEEAKTAAEAEQRLADAEFIAQFGDEIRTNGRYLNYHAPKGEPEKAMTIAEHALESAEANQKVSLTVGELARLIRWARLAQIK